MSAASVWEAAIKAALGKLSVDGDLAEEIAANDFAELPVTARHALAAAALPRHHDDPFDRMLIAQARLEGLVLVTRDPVFDLYGFGQAGILSLGEEKTKTPPNKSWRTATTRYSRLAPPRV